MIIAVIVIGMIILFLCWAFFKEEKRLIEEEESRLSPSDSAIRQKQYITDESTDKHNADLDIVLQLLRNMGCPYHYDSNIGQYVFQYQGLDFLIRSSQEEHVLHCVLPYWYEVAFDDFEHFAHVRKCINQLNQHIDVNATFYTRDDDHRKFNIHTCADFPMFDSLPAKSDYLKHVLNGLTYVRNRGTLLFDKKED